MSYLRLIHHNCCMISRSQTSAAGEACTLIFFFFSSRRRHTRCSRDWSSDVCSSDLQGLHTGRIASVEALLRWHDPENGLTSPAVFLPLLESAGLMGATGAWVLRQAASDCRAWRCKGLPPIRVAVNISPPELRQRNIAGEILEAIGDLAGDPA